MRFTPFTTEEDYFSRPPRPSTRPKTDQYFPGVFVTGTVPADAPASLFGLEGLSITGPGSSFVSLAVGDRLVIKAGDELELPRLLKGARLALVADITKPADGLPYAVVRRVSWIKSA